MSKIIKSISFNEADPFEEKLYRHAEKQGRFATYVKRLIQRDMEGGGLHTAPTKKVAAGPLIGPDDDLNPADWT